jgi:hypothetical protein
MFDRRWRNRSSVFGGLGGFGRINGLQAFPSSNHDGVRMKIPDVNPAHKSQAFTAATRPTLRNQILPNAQNPL